MKPEQLISFRDKKTRIKLNLKDKRFFSGYIKEVLGDSLVFIDKFHNEIVIDLESVSYIVPIRMDGGKDGQEHDI